MEIKGIFAVVCVSDIEQSKSWYTKLLGRKPDDEPMEGLVQWHDLGGAGLQLVSDSQKAGNSLLTIVVPKTSRIRRELAAVEIELEPDVQGDFGKLAQAVDLDGNRITLAEPPAGI